MAINEADFLVRKATAGDFLGVLRVLQRDPHMSGESASAPQRAMWERMLATADLTVIVAEIAGEIVGITSLQVMPHLTYGCQPTAFIEPVVVAEPYRRRGVATAMLTAALEYARADDCRKVQLLSHKRHAGDGAHALYRRAGFDAEAEGFRLYLDERPTSAPQPVVPLEE